MRHDRSVLWINDTPDEYLGNGSAAVPHGHVYFESSRPCIQVSFQALNGTAVRVSFDPKTGEVTTSDITEAQR